MEKLPDQIHPVNISSNNGGEDLQLLRQSCWEKKTLSRHDGVHRLKLNKLIRGIAGMEASWYPRSVIPSVLVWFVTEKSFP